jgi:hypothetical protein
MATLDHLPAGHLWSILDTALAAAEGDFPWPPDDGRILPEGVWIGGAIDTTSPTLEAFTLAAISHPGLTAGSRPSPELALTSTPMLCTAIDKVLASQLPWLERYGVPEDAARQRGTSLKDQLIAAAQAARRDQEQAIRNSPVRDAAVAKLRAEARAAFHAADITTRLLTWAGNPPSTTARRQEEGACLLVPITAPRHMFISDDDGDITGLATLAGRALADTVLKYMMITASANAEARAISPADGAIKVRDAIAEVRGTPPAKLVVIIPDFPYALRKDMGITADKAGAELSDQQRHERNQIIEELGLTSSDLTLKLTGTIDGAPVIKTRNLAGRIIIINLTRLKATLFVLETNGSPPEPDLMLIHPGQASAAVGTQESSTPPDAAASEPSLGNDTACGHDGDALQLRFRLRFPLELSATGQPLAQILYWNDEWPN